MKTRALWKIRPLIVSLLFLAVAHLACASTGQAQNAAPGQLVERPMAAACQQSDDKPIYRVDAPAYSPVKGNAQTARVTIVEFSEFQCPFCAKAADTIGRLLEEHGQQVRWVFRHNPLAFHKQAMSASLAAAAAGRQDRFWPMHDLLFENRSKLDEDSLFGYANELGLDMRRFEADFRSPAIKAEIEADMAEARRLGANGVPTFFINGLELRGAQPIGKFEEAVRAALAHAQTQPWVGQELYERLIECGLSERAQPRPSQVQPRPSPLENLAKIHPVSAGGAYSIGGQQAPIEIIVFSDFQCPYCQRVAQTLVKVLEHYGPKIRVVFKHFPLPFHKQAHLASQAALAAGAQGKFWEMHDAIFENARQLSEEKLEELAARLGLDMQMFVADLREGRYKTEVDSDMAEGKAIGVTGTPTSFINGHKLTGAQPYENFIQAIDKLLGIPPLPAEKPLP